MAIDERQRHQLHERLDEVLGAEEAAILMSHLPPRPMNGPGESDARVGWAEVATKHDLDSSVAVLRSEFRSSLHEEVGRLREDVHRQLGGIHTDMARGQRQLVFAILASQFTAVSLAFAAASL